MTAASSTALLTDKYELTMVSAALQDGTRRPADHLRGLRPPAARRPTLRRARRNRAPAGGIGRLHLRRRHPGDNRKESHGGRKSALRLARHSGVVTEEVVYPFGAPPPTDEPARVLTIPLVRGGRVLAKPDLAAARDLVAAGLHRLPREGRALSSGEPAIPTRQMR